MLYIIVIYIYSYTHIYIYLSNQGFSTTSWSFKNAEAPRMLKRTSWPQRCTGGWPGHRPWTICSPMPGPQGPGNPQEIPGNGKSPKNGKIWQENMEVSKQKTSWFFLTNLKMVIFYSYIKLPEGIWKTHPGRSCSTVNNHGFSLLTVGFSDIIAVIDI